MKAKIVVCASGEGTNFEAMVRATQKGELEAEVVGLIANRPRIGALGRAKILEIPYRTLAAKDFTSSKSWDRALADQLQEWKADWVVLAGFLALIGPEVLKRYPRRIVNSHPALLPQFGGPGMYGDRVHQAVLAAGAKETGITIHAIDEEYDRGQVLAQERIKVLPGDTAASLSARVKAREVQFYPKVLNDLVTGRITIG